jgi:hypothetical protein
MDVMDLRVRANRENVDLGAPPANAPEHELWREERRSPLAAGRHRDHDAELLRRAATGEWVTPAARDLLLDAARRGHRPSEPPPSRGGSLRERVTTRPTLPSFRRPASQGTTRRAKGETQS